MTTHPEALRLAAELDHGYPLTGDAISAAAELRRQHARITKLEAQLSAIGAGGVSPLRNAAQETEATHLRELAAPSTDQVEEILRERDDADDFIDALLDEVLGHERPEWSSAYGRADALNDVRERMTALHKPAVDKAWDRFQSAMEAPQQPAPSPVPAGWKLVPVEPTEEMLKAADDGDDAYTLRCFGPGVQRVMQGPYDHYCAMLDAAPTAQADTQPAQQGVAYAALPTHSHAGRVYEEGFLIGTCPLYTADQLRAFADATYALRASHGQAPAPEDSVQEDALSDSVRTPLDSLHADAAYLIGRLRDGSMPYARVIEIIRERIDAAKAAIRARAAHGQAPANPSPPEGMVGGWLPIETAPKNGTEILGYTEEVGALVLYWDSMTGEMDHWSDGMSVSFWKPTHWMHLPAAPGPADGESK